MTNFYTSDLHLNHVRLIESKFRGFVDETYMNFKILDNINKRVKRSDTLFILGDLCMTNKLNDAYLEMWLKEIECYNIVVIRGNHDNVNTLQRLKDEHIIRNWHQFKTVKDTAFGIECNLALFHHPVIDYHTSQHCCACLHGHSHGMLKNAPPDLFDVGLDVFDFKPVTFEEILAKYYGHHPNPYIGYIDYVRQWKTAYKEFWEKQDEQR